MNPPNEPCTEVCRSVWFVLITEDLFLVEEISTVVFFEDFSISVVPSLTFHKGVYPLTIVLMKSLL